jgi:hypothetical protein
MMEEGSMQWVDLGRHHTTATTTAAAAAGPDTTSCIAVDVACEQRLPGTEAATMESDITPPPPPPAAAAAGGLSPAAPGAAAAATATAAAAAADMWPPSRRRSLEMDASQHQTPRTALSPTSCAAATDELTPSPPAAAAAMGKQGGEAAAAAAAGSTLSTRPWLPPLLPAVPPGSTLDLQDLLKAIPPGVPVNPDLPPVRVNPKQYRCILRRRLQRVRAAQEQRGVVAPPHKVGGGMAGCEDI